MMKAHLDRGPSALVMGRESRWRHSIKENAPGRIHVPPGLGLSHFTLKWDVKFSFQNNACPTCPSCPTFFPTPYEKECSQQGHMHSVQEREKLAAQVGQVGQH